MPGSLEAVQAVTRVVKPARFIFVSVWEREDRTREWYDAERLNYPSDEEFFQEYPETVDQMLGGQSAGQAYTRSSVAAAEALGRLYDAMLEAENLPDSLDGELEFGVDWGKNSAAEYLYPLPAFGIYICDEMIAYEAAMLSAEVFSARAVAKASGWERKPDWGKIYGGVKLTRVAFDAADPQKGLSLRHATPDDADVGGVPFGDYKASTVEFLRTMLRRTEEWHSRDFDGNQIGFIAISPRCKQLLSELKSLQVDDEGKIVKPKSNDGKTDHAHDAAVAVLARWGSRWRQDYQS